MSHYKKFIIKNYKELKGLKIQPFLAYFNHTPFKRIFPLL